MTELRELSSSESIHVRALARSASHPRNIDSYLEGRGYSADEIQHAFDTLGISRAEMLRGYRLKKSVVLSAIAAVLTTTTAVLFTGLITIGLAISAFMSLMAAVRKLRRRNREQQQTGWLHRRRFTPR